MNMTVDEMRNEVARYCATIGMYCEECCLSKICNRAICYWEDETDEKIKSMYEILKKETQTVEWVKDGKAYFCSNCGENPLLNINHEIEFTDYCPHCGCKMVGVED